MEFTEQDTGEARLSMEKSRFSKFEKLDFCCPDKLVDEIPDWVPTLRVQLDRTYDCIPNRLAGLQGHRKEVLAGAPKTKTNHLLAANVKAAVIASATWTKNGNQRFICFSIWLPNHSYGRPRFIPMKSITNFRVASCNDGSTKKRLFLIR
jgi:hypothetical protein